MKGTTGGIMGHLDTAEYAEDRKPSERQDDLIKGQIDPMGHDGPLVTFRHPPLLAAAGNGESFDIRFCVGSLTEQRSFRCDRWSATEQTQLTAFQKLPRLAERWNDH